MMAVASGRENTFTDISNLTFAATAKGRQVNSCISAHVHDFTQYKHLKYTIVYLGFSISSFIKIYLWFQKSVT